MSYKLRFHKKALKEWEKLDNETKEQFKKKLKERLKNPYVKKDKLRKIKSEKKGLSIDVADILFYELESPIYSKLQ